MTMEATLLALTSLVPFASFVWGVVAHFRKSAATPWGMQALSVFNALGYATFLLCLRHEDILTEGATSIAIALFGASFALFWWTARTTRALPPRIAHSKADADTLYRHGPYAFARHPFYLSYMIFWVASAVGVGGVQWLVCGAFIGWYALLARSEERRFSSSALAAGYMEYRHQTAMFVPKLTKAMLGRKL
ncbi:isoprenylcysteine carboxylmethyltransferase family protein [Acetobacter sp. DsW_063]|uniref:methyltransferase family protein n=1 Tax=Acetobacter sp. DsW_063 TaxID=1514894 RepID=UPI000A3BA81F|nr:hypothetical protein [Acetobacter sp. DsW_063]